MKHLPNYFPLLHYMELCFNVLLRKSINALKDMNEMGDMISGDSATANDTD